MRGGSTLGAPGGAAARQFPFDPMGPLIDAPKKMKWSQLKIRIEGTFADSVKGRVQVWNTRYRRSHDQEGEAWVTIDKERVFSMGTYTYFLKCNQEADRLRAEQDCTDFRDPDQKQGYYGAWREAHKKAEDEGAYPLWDVNAALFAYLNLAIDDIVSSENPIIRAIGMLDRRLGKRRLAALDVKEEHSLVKLLHDFRCSAEGITATRESPHLNNDDPKSPPSANELGT